VKRLFALVAIVVCQVLSGAESYGQQRPGNSGVTSASSTRSGAVKKQKVSASAIKSNSAKKSGVVRPASFAQGGEVIDQPSVMDAECTSCAGGESGCDGSCDGGCDAGCGSCSVGGTGGLCYENYGRVYISLPAHGWVHAEGLNWYQKGMHIPVLVRQTNATGPILFGGNNDFLSGSTGGFRIRFGTWLGSIPRLGVEGEYVGLGKKTDSFSDTTTANKVVPFNDITTGQVRTLSHPNSAALLENQLYGAAVRFRRQLCCNTGCGFSEWTCQTVPVSTRVDLTAGYRYWQLDEQVTFSQGTSTAPFFNTEDVFKTSNLFNGAELGVVWQGRRGWWSLDTLMRVAFGNVQQTVTINGSSRLGTAPTTVPNSGLLALSSNRGTYTRDVFTMVPEFGATLGYQVTRRLRATIGYSAIYWGNVVRPGDQISLDINPALFPSVNNPNPTATGLQRPQFQFVQTDYWVQGLSFGGEFRW
jgi:Putative beta barrel porin-7 (BBP7)